MDNESKDLVINIFLGVLSGIIANLIFIGLQSYKE